MEIEKIEPYCHKFVHSLKKKEQVGLKAKIILIVNDFTIELVFIELMTKVFEFLWFYLKSTGKRFAKDLNLKW
ncbi:hypothetical protein LPC_2182 [Legionella pneumophila str. Corby]|nr:hypothetical protein LPC_2182 [Legionella pneumophila str. Corby]